MRSSSVLVSFSLIVVAASALTVPNSGASPLPKASPDARELRLPGEPVEPSLDFSPAASSAKPATPEDAKRAAWYAAHCEVSRDHLSKIVLGFHNEHDQFKRFAGNIVKDDFTPLLSWRVKILPFMECQELYNAFHRDEPWDSPHNLKLLEKMPAVYASPRVKGARKGHTVYQGFSGPDAVFRPGLLPLSLRDIPDGAANTLLVVESSAAVPWTKPIDIPFDPQRDVPDFGKAYGGRPLAALTNGAVRYLDLKKIRMATLKDAICPNDGHPLGDDWRE